MNQTLDDLRREVQLHFYLLRPSELTEPHNVGWWAREADMPPPTNAEALGGWLLRDNELRQQTKNCSTCDCEFECQNR